MLSSLKKWVQDVTVDLNPSSAIGAVPPQPSPSFFSSPSTSDSAHQHYYYSSPSSHVPQRSNERLSNYSSASSTARLSRPISMDSVRSSRSSKVTATSVPPQPVSPVELDLSHLNREEQEHIANVLKRARAVDDQQSSAPPATIPSVASPPASILSASLSPSTSSASSPSSSSSSSSTSSSPRSSFTTAQPKRSEQNDQNDNNDDNEMEEGDESSLPEPTLITVHRCQVCNKEQQANRAICLHFQESPAITSAMPQNPTSLTPPRESSPSALVPMGFADHEDEKIDDHIMRIHQEPIKRNSPIPVNVSHLPAHSVENSVDREDQEDDGKQRRHSPVLDERTAATATTLPASVSTRANNLTEIDEDDFFYQGPSPYATAVDLHSMTEKIEEAAKPSYKIDEYVDEDEHDERDHVKELEETIANLSRHFPSSSQNEPILANLHQQPSTLSVAKIDIDSILEMEIESPSTEERFIQSSSSVPLSRPSSEHPLNVPISVPISIQTRRGSLSRSSGVRENLTNLLTTVTTEPSLDNQPLQRTSSTSSKRVIPIHRQKRNLPSVPTSANHLRLRRANSESRFSLPAVPSSILIVTSNIDDESDLLEIDLNDPTGSLNRAARSKTESELANRYERATRSSSHHTTVQFPSTNELSSSHRPIKQLRDQTTNTPPISNFNSSAKMKKKLKKKGSSSPNDIPNEGKTSTQSNGPMTPSSLSPTRSNPPSTELSPTPTLSTNTSRPKLQKSTSTEMSYPFPVSKLLLIRDTLSPSRQTETDLGFRITGGHSIAHCMEVTACIEQIDTRHRNYNILKNAVQEGDEVLEVGGVPLRGKSLLFVQNLMNSIRNEFEIVVRSQHVIPPISQAIQLHRPSKSTTERQPPNKLEISHNTLSVVDPNSPRRHSMDTSQLSPTHAASATVVKSQSTIMPLPMEVPTSVSDQLHLPSMARKKSVSSKERLFSVDSLRRSSSSKAAPPTEQTSNLRLSQLSELDAQDSAKEGERSSVTSLKQTSLAVTTADNRMFHDESASLTQPLPRRRLYEHRNSLLPNDPGLNGAGNSSNVDRRNSNESDESDSLSQYFRSPSSRKSSLLANIGMPSVVTSDVSAEAERSSGSAGDEAAIIASRRLQSFLQSSGEQRQSRDSADGDSAKAGNTGERKSSSGLASLNFLKKKTKSVDLPNPPVEIRENDYVGDIELQIGHNSDREQLVVKIIRAKNLLAKDTNGYSDPFVKVYLLPGRDQENKRRTKYISKSLNPVWEHTVLYGNMHREELQYKMLEFTVWDYDRFKANDFLGQITINLKDANVIDDKPHWYRLQALRAREEVSNRGSSPGLYKMTSVDSTASSTLTLNRNTINMQPRVNQRL